MERAGGGTSEWFREGLQAQQLDVDTPPRMEVMFFRVVLADRSTLLLCALYHPSRRGPAAVQYLTDSWNDLMTT